MMTTDQQANLILRQVLDWVRHLPDCALMQRERKPCSCGLQTLLNTAADLLAVEQTQVQAVCDQCQRESFEVLMIDKPCGAKLGEDHYCSGTMRTDDASHAYLIFFDDYDRRPEVFTGRGSRRGSRERFKQISASWNAHLFQRIGSNSTDAGKCFASGCNELAQPDGLLCKRHYDELPPALKGE